MVSTILELLLRSKINANIGNRSDETLLQPAKFINSNSKNMILHDGICLMHIRAQLKKNNENVAKPIIPK